MNEQKKTRDTDPENRGTAESSSMVDEKKKLNELRAMILHKGDAERERIRQEAFAEAQKWTDEHMKQLEAMISDIKTDAAQRSQEMATRQLIDAEAARDKDRLRLQNTLVQKALLMLQNALTAFDQRPDYDTILTGVAAEVCERLPSGQKVKMCLRAEDASHGDFVASALRTRFPNLNIVFDRTPAVIVGGVLLYSEEEKWRVVADWKSKVEEMADLVAKTVLAEL